MDSPPQSPTLSHRRHPSNISTAHNDTPTRRSSAYQGYSPIASPVQTYDGELEAPTASGGGLGSLADELGGDWDEEDDVEDDSHMTPDGPRDSGFGGENAESVHKKSLSVTVAGHRRNESMYDGSDYGDDDDLEASEGISVGLERQMAEVESLARRGLETNGSVNDGVVARVTETLRDLGSQAGVESSASRYVPITGL